MTEASLAHPPEVSTTLARPVMFAMAIACAVGVATIYYNQPMLGVIQHDFPHERAAGLIPTATQIGYALGLFLLVPLGDVLDRRRLITGQFLVLAAALAAAAAAPGAWTLVGASLLVGVAASVAQQIVPYAASLAAPDRRGFTVGVVMGGLLCGILLSRTLAGLVAGHFGWRAMFWIAVPMTLACALLMRCALPADPKRSQITYGQALGSLSRLWTRQNPLRRATFIQAGLFASFSVFWTVLALHLEQKPLSAGPGVAGLFGILGAAGVCAAPVAGRLADARGPRLAIGLGAALALVSWVSFGIWTAIPGLILGVLLLDFGVQSALVSNQHVIYALDAAASSRINTIFMTGMFLGGAAGSAGAMAVWREGAGWSSVSLLGAVLACLALIIVLRDAKPNTP